MALRKLGEERSREESALAEAPRGVSSGSEDSKPAAGTQGTQGRVSGRGAVPGPGGSALPDRILQAMWPQEDWLRNDGTGFPSGRTALTTSTLDYEGEGVRVEPEVSSEGPGGGGGRRAAGPGGDWRQRAPTCGWRRRAHGWVPRV